MGGVQQNFCVKEGILKERCLTGGSECQVSSHLRDPRSGGWLSDYLEQLLTS